MTQVNSLFPEQDPIARRRRALAKVYALLIRLVEEAEAKRKIAAELAADVEKKTGDKTPLRE